MSGPRFVIGQSVAFERTASTARANGPYEVIRVLPADGPNTRTYRIKSKVEPFERTANEYDLVAVGVPLGERGATPWVTAALKRQQ
jgi:hypothetical protein